MKTIIFFIFLAGENSFQNYCMKDNINGKKDYNIFFQSVSNISMKLFRDTLVQYFALILAIIYHANTDTKFKFMSAQENSETKFLFNKLTAELSLT